MERSIALRIAGNLAAEATRVLDECTDMLPQ